MDGTPRLTPRAKALIRAYEFANERAMRTQDTRDHVEALALKRAAEAELERVPGTPPRSKRMDKTWLRQPNAKSGRSRQIVSAVRMKAVDASGLRQPLGNVLELGRIVPRPQAEMVMQRERKRVVLAARHHARIIGRQAQGIQLAKGEIFRKDARGDLPPRAPAG